MAENNIKESISALVDGELNESETHDAIRALRGADSEQRACWESYHLIGDALRKNVPKQMDTQLLSRINDAIASEPPLQQQAKPEQVVVNKFFKPVAGFSVAASVAAVAYIGVGMMSVEEVAMGPRLAETAPTILVPAMTVADQSPAASNNQWDVAQPALESRLNLYLSNHQAAAMVTGMNGRMLPHAYVVVEHSARTE